MKSHSRVETSNGSLHIMRWSPYVGPARGAVIFSHGFTVPGFESHRMFLAAAERVVEHGFEAWMFDYRGSGYSDLAFPEMTFGSEVEDLFSVVKHVKEQTPGLVVIWGQSVGSAVAAHVSARVDDVDGLILWATSSDLYRRFSARPAFQPLLNGADVAYLDSGFEISRTFLESLKIECTPKSLAEFSGGILLVHGTSDDKASVSLSVDLADDLDGRASLFLVEGGNHGFKGQPAEFGQAVDRSLSWLSELSRSAV